MALRCWDFYAGNHREDDQLRGEFLSEAVTGWMDPRLSLASHNNGNPPDPLPRDRRPARRSRCPPSETRLTIQWWRRRCSLPPKWVASEDAHAELSCLLSKAQDLLEDILETQRFAGWGGRPSHEGVPTQEERAEGRLESRGRAGEAEAAWRAKAETGAERSAARPREGKEAVRRGYVRQRSGRWRFEAGWLGTA